MAFDVVAYLYDLGTAASSAHDSEGIDESRQEAIRGSPGAMAAEGQGELG